MFMYNDVMVNYQQRVEHEYIDFYEGSLMFPMKFGGMSRVVHILEVRSLDVEVTVNCETGYGFSAAVVISTLLAALKNIDDGFIYNLARKKIESQMGFQVDDLIPAHVAKPTDVTYGIDRTRWDFTIVASVCRGPIQKPNLVLIKQDDKPGSLTLRLEYYSGVHQGYIELQVDDDIMINGNQAMLQQAHERLWYQAYEKMPMLAPDLSYMRYTEGILNGGKYHTGKYQAPKFAPNFSSPLHKKPGLPYSSEKDSRVDELPGVKEVVKHPVTGCRATLEKVIISLNDSYDWSREEIADWLETLDIDITFKSKETNEQD